MVLLKPIGKRGMLGQLGCRMNKTLYIRNEDGPLWDRARELADDKLSPVIVEALKEFVRDKESEAIAEQGFERILIEFRDSLDNGVPKAKSFVGRWIFPPKHPQVELDSSGSATMCCAVAVTAKGNAVLYSWHVAQNDEAFGHRVSIYPSLHDAAEEPRTRDAVLAAIEKEGVPVEYLDI